MLLDSHGNFRHEDTRSGCQVARIHKVKGVSGGKEPSSKLLG